MRGLSFNFSLCITIRLVFGRKCLNSSPKFDPASGIGQKTNAVCWDVESSLTSHPPPDCSEHGGWSVEEAIHNYKLCSWWCQIEHLRGQIAFGDSSRRSHSFEPWHIWLFRFRTSTAQLHVSSITHYNNPSTAPLWYSSWNGFKTGPFTTWDITQLHTIT